MFLHSKYLSKLLLLSLTLAFLSCDDGRIYEEEYVPDTSGKVMKLTASMTNLDTWPRGYSIVLAGFQDNDEYAVITKPVPFPKKGSDAVELVMSGIPGNVTSLHLCVVNRQRILVHSYAEMPCPREEGDTLLMDLQGRLIDANMYDALQQEVFNSAEYSCFRCHSAGGHAGGLVLENGKSYAELMNKSSLAAAPGAPLVKSGDAENSVLYQILTSDAGKALSYDHSEILINSYTDKALVKDWIDNGAKEK